MRHRATASFASCGTRSRATPMPLPDRHRARCEKTTEARRKTMAKTFKDLMQDARGVVREWTPDEVRDHLSNGGGYTLLDVREKDEYRDGHLTGAVSVPRGFLDM